MASGPYIVASADHSFRVIGDGGSGETMPYVLVSFHAIPGGSYHLVARRIDGPERSCVCGHDTTAADLVDWWLGAVRDLAVA